MIGSLFYEILEFIVFWLSKQKRKKEEWLGVLKEKRVKGGYSISKQRHELIFRKEDGKKVKIKVDKEVYALYEQGKRYLKRSGEFLPDPATGVKSPRDLFY
jgi:hypothetical protein